MKISIQGVGKTYKTGKIALKKISIEITSPNMIGLVGPNGAGKSTLMKLLVAALLPTTGSISFNNEPLYKKEKVLKSILGYLPQSFGLYDELTVWQFLDYMAALKGIKNPKDAIEKVINETNLDEKKNAKIKTLSGGQRQRVGIAQALIGNPKLLILDEPTVGLDPEERIKFRNLFSKYAQDKIVILSTHIIEDVQSICNRIIVINEGMILFDGRPDELIQAANGHVGIIEQEESLGDKDYKITARINTARGVMCRIVADTLPPFAQPVEPSLEDAYMFLIERR
ncbi:ATP-binding cassette domain-containing protein [Tepidimicrobium xylanilyticum]|uniref:ATP-binding cassette domain-containing protein n=1 Tax=Tepidimicrobium xylanilyticum TaxID=1123352 RepID=UPI002654C170|nr:ATP-binding cassette domain-containing protein [Tepidimicrobium xylanilyticum]GMG97330.1 ABC transporter ATP-binding protein [Tepidimicrobium xylanilyticum]